MKKEVTVPNFVELEKGILKFWKENDSFHKLVKKNAGHDRFKFLDVLQLQTTVLGFTIFGEEHSKI